MADDFASLMRSSDLWRTSARVVKNGDAVEGAVIQIGEEFVFVDLGGRADGRIDRGELLDSSARLRVKVGDLVRATVIDAGDPLGPLLATSFGKGSIDASGIERARELQLPVEGAVLRLVKGGAEVDVAGVRAFCPASQLDVGRAEPTEAWVGRTERFAVLEVRDGGRSVVVSRRVLLEAEREVRQREAAERLLAGTDVQGTVTSIQKYGAFVDVGGVEGLVHISELSSRRINKPEDVVKVGDAVKVRVLGTELTDGALRVRLSMKALDQSPEDFEEFARGRASGLGSLGDVFRERLGLPPAAPEPRRTAPVAAQAPFAPAPAPAPRVEPPPPAAPVQAGVPPRAAPASTPAPAERRAPPDGVVRRRR